MKSTDLMIGDWIYYPNNTPQKITGLVPGIDENNNIHYQFFNDVEWYELDSAKPIPLTPEILEKNGFTKELYDGVHYRYGIVIDGIGFSVRYVRSVFQWLGPLDFHYVHELQHALRLCGIEKEIVL